jgi:hypothetical protein
MIEAHRDYPVPKNMNLAEAEALLARCRRRSTTQPTAQSTAKPTALQTTPLTT